MSIHIKNINVKNLGPIPELTQELRNINLFYGNNEKGKSYLVEFIIRSLFKTSGWSLRDNIGTGKINVAGLLDESQTFTPDSQKKLVDFLTEKYSALPPDFAKLLVVEATSVKLGEEKESDRETLRRFLSHKHILNKIKDNIQTTVQNCSITDYTITGDKRGKLADRKKLKNKVDKIEELYTAIENKFFSGEIRNLKDEQKRLSEQYNKLERAKRYKAYQLAEKMKNITQKSEKINEDEIDALLDEINELHRDERAYNSKIDKLENLEESTQYYEWLQEAIDEYKEYNLGEITEKPSNWFFIIIGLLFIVTIGSIYIGQKWIGGGGVVALLIAGFFYKRAYDKYLRDTGRRQELKSIKADFRSKFKASPDNLAVMEEKLGQMQDSYNKRTYLKDEIEELEKKIRNTEIELENKIFEYFNEKVEKDKWQEKLKEEKRKKRNLEEEKKDLELEQNRLGVAEENYITEKPGEEFERDRYTTIKNDLEELKEKIAEKEKELEKIKQEVCFHTDDDISTEWMELISNLSGVREQKIEEYKEITSDIMAGKYVTAVLNDLIEEEDKKIHEALKSNVIKDTLLKITTHYNDISLEDNRLIVSDKFNSFPVSTISDGAQEQVFLALRIALAKEWFKREELFLILDDAFIHSDKNRKPELVEKTIQLSKNGWQILCFTFDDRIKDLFEERSGDGYQLIDLNGLG